VEAHDRRDATTGDVQGFEAHGRHVLVGHPDGSWPAPTRGLCRRVHHLRRSGRVDDIRRIPPAEHATPGRRGSVVAGREVGRSLGGYQRPLRIAAGRRQTSGTSAAGRGVDAGVGSLPPRADESTVSVAGGAGLSAADDRSWLCSSTGGRDGAPPFGSAWTRPVYGSRIYATPDPRR
jgi:hypothetical protein